MLWRLLRIGSAPYFVLGAAPSGFLRLRIATPWDWRQHFELRAFDVEPRAGGQPMVAWRAVVRERATDAPSASSTATSRSAGATAASRAARGQGVPRHAAHRRAGLLRAAVAAAPVP